MRTSFFSCFLAALAVAACTPPDRSHPTSFARPRSEVKAVAFDLGCHGVSPALPKAACADGSVAFADEAVAQALASQAAKLSHEGQAILLDSQGQWFGALRAACGLAGARTAVSPEAAWCATSWLADRRLAIATMIDVLPPFVFQRVDRVQISEAHVGADQSQPPLISFLSYPRIDAADPFAQAFNAAAAHGMRFSRSDPAEEILTYRIAFADQDFVSIDFQDFDSNADGSVLHHDMQALTLVAPSARPLAASDIFRLGSGWEKALMSAGLASVRAASQTSQVCATPISEASARTALIRPDRWLVSESGLGVLFPPGALAPNAPAGCEIEIPWRVLSPYLSKSAPGPAQRRTSNAPKRIASR